MAAVLMMLALASPLPPQDPAPNVHEGAGRIRCRAACHVRAHQRRVVAPHRAHLTRMARCESTGRWHVNTGNGFYGGLQFTWSSWHAVGGRGYPHQATRLEQMYRAVLLKRVQGWGAWPVCQYA
jgi:hypothetical protein